jgi:four helix bundle protein
MRERDIDQRTFEFARGIVGLCQKLEKRNPIVRRLALQLLDAGTSVGANCEEGGAGFTKADFVYKHSVCLKEAKESRYWMRLIKDADPPVSGEIDPLLQEAHELSLIFAAIVRNAKAAKSRHKSSPNDDPSRH